MKTTIYAVMIMLILNGCAIRVVESGSYGYNDYTYKSYQYQNKEDYLYRPVIKKVVHIEIANKTAETYSQHTQKGSPRAGLKGKKPHRNER